MNKVLVSLSLALISSAASADVFTVAQQGGADFSSIQPAVDAASDGDTIIIRPPTTNTFLFGSFTIDGKSLSVIGPTEGVKIRMVVVRNLDATQAAYLSLLSFGRGVTLEDNTGTVLMRSCNLQTATLQGVDSSVRNCRSISLVDCRVYGRTGLDSDMPGVPGTVGGVGLVIENSRVALYGGELRGGVGGMGDYDLYVPVDSDGGPGGTGISLVASELFLAGTDVHGGKGGDQAFTETNGSGGDGGTAMIVGPGSLALRRNSMISAGSGGWGVIIGQDGATAVGQVVSAAGGQMRVRVPRVALQGEEILLQLSGEPGLEVVWFESNDLGWNRRGIRRGVMHGAGPIRRIATGVIPPCGEWTVPYRVPAGTAGSGLGVMLQAAVQHSGQGVLLSEPTFLPTLDSLGHPNCGRRRYVNANAPAGGNGLSWATAFNGLTTALNGVRACTEHTTEIWIAEGTYYPAPFGGQRNLKFDLESGTHVYGGFAGGETHLRQRDPELHPVILSGDLGQNDAQGVRSDNSYNVVSIRYNISLPRNIKLDGLTIEAGETFIRGAGIDARGDLELRNCTIRDCYADDRGAAIAFQGENLKIVNCRLIGNRIGTDLGTHEGGAGISASWSTEYSSGSISIVNTTIEGNTGGAGLSITRSGQPSPSLTHPYRGLRAEVRHCTIAGNTSPNPTAGLVAPEIPVLVTNTVLWGNEGSAMNPDQIQQINVDASASLGYLCIEGLDGTLAGPGHIGQDPLFVDPLGPDGIPGTIDDDYRLGFGSPCVDAGANALSACDTADQNVNRDHNEPVPVDQAGMRRFLDDPTVPDQGQGVTPIVDIGARERAN